MDAYTRLLAAQMHESEGEQSPIEIKSIENDAGHELIAGRFCADVTFYADVDNGPDSHVYMSKRYIYNGIQYHDSLTESDIRTPQDIDLLIALLQRAKAIMGGGA